jgi:prevent-host-death family protein
MRTVGLFEAKQKLSELVERAEDGERIGITRRGKLVAVMVSAHPGTNLKQVFEEIELIRRRARLSKGMSVRRLIEEGRV